MKYPVSLFAVLASFMLLSSCGKDACTRTVTYTKYEPVYLAPADYRVDPVLESPRTLKNPGKIYLYGNLILINERSEGIHVIDNANPSAPNNIAFIKIPGNIDIAVKASTLYADNYTDLLAIDISDINNIRLAKRVNDALPSYGTDGQGRLLVDYAPEEVTEEIACDQWMNVQTQDPRLAQNPWGAQPGLANDPNTANMGGGGVSGAGREAIGIAGSMSRFAINGQVLYIIDHQNMHVYNITDTENPYKASDLTVGTGWGIETIFPYRNHLFIGSTNGMFIYDNSNPLAPSYVSEFQHEVACDPVYVDGNFAYVTLRGGNRCGGWANQLDVIDISDIQQPRLVSSNPMEHPHGLSIENNELYLCDGKFGLKVLDITDKTNVTQLYANNASPAYDAINIPNLNTVLVVGADGLHQYSTNDPRNLQQISLIPVE